MEQGEPPPLSSILVVHDTARARDVARNKSVYWLSRIEETDRIYPYEPFVALKLMEWYRLLETSAPAPQDKKLYADASLKWAKEAVRRSPQQPWYHSFYGRALWMRATYDPWPANLDFYVRGLDEYRKARDLYSISPGAWKQYAAALDELGSALVRTGRDRAKGERMIQEAKEASAHAQELAKGPVQADKELEQP